jgi:hypothetical protein
MAQASAIEAIESAGDWMPGRSRTALWRQRAMIEVRRLRMGTRDEI